ncbi:MAG: helix-turn-helix domain-containing protein [Proteobacteria bacterium]|nr:helix-turn-helix domain-containing protein [Pseudomonadota bacterium]
MSISLSSDDIRLAISLMVIGQQFLLALLLFKVQPVIRPQWLGAGLLFGVMAYLTVSNPVLSEATLHFRPLLLALAIAVPYLLWEFAVAVFEIRSLPIRYRLVLYLVPLATWLFVVNNGDFDSLAGTVLGVGNRLISLVLIAYGVVSVAVDRKHDLLEPRRSYRALFVGSIAVQVSAVIIVELVLGNEGAAGWLELINVVAIAMLTVILGLPLLSVTQQVLWGTEVPAQATLDGVPPAVQVLRQALQTAMQAGFYRTPGLSISEFAVELKVPEHQLRRLINQHLGYRNFSSFLNDYRIREAQDRLADPGSVRRPILTIAMELGYGSIGPFNRAFKEATGVTPSDYRRQKLGKALAESE